MLSERTITERLRERAGIPANSPLILGIGDDCAIYRPRGSADDLLFTTDLCIEQVHFSLDTHKPADIAWVAMARSISDIAAMGGQPRFSIVSVSLGEVKFAPTALFDALARYARDFGAPLAGGDLARSDRTFLDVMIAGAAPRGTALRRDGAKPGHEIWVSGALGGSALGLEAKSRKEKNGNAWRRHVHPQPRLALGEFLRMKLRATSCMDLSDGLSLDLRRLCLASGVAADIVEPPRFPGASAEQALHGGEDYELLFTVRPGTRVPSRYDRAPLTRIGNISDGPAGEVRLNGAVLPALGYDHLAR